MGRMGAFLFFGNGPRKPTGTPTGEKGQTRFELIRKQHVILRVDSPFFPTIVLFENRPFPWLSGGFLERRIPGKNGDGSTRVILSTLALEPPCPLQTFRVSLEKPGSP